MKSMMYGKMLRANDTGEALKYGNPIKIWDGKSWVLAILYKTPEQEGTEEYSYVRVI